MGQCWAVMLAVTGSFDLRLPPIPHAISADYWALLSGNNRNFFRPAVDMPSNLAQKLGQRARVGCIFKPILQLSLDFLADYIVSWPHYGPLLRNDTIKTERAIHGNIC